MGVLGCPNCICGWVLFQKPANKVQVEFTADRRPRPRLGGETLQVERRNDMKRAILAVIAVDDHEVRAPVRRGKARDKGRVLQPLKLFALGVRRFRRYLQEGLVAIRSRTQGMLAMAERALERKLAEDS